LQNPENPYSNPKITLIAEANSVVVTPTCKLSNADNLLAYKEYCSIQLEIEAFIDSLSFGNYISFEFQV
jgi:hypothetical protein